MERKPFESMSAEELRRLHTLVNDVLAVRLPKKEDLERRLGFLNRGYKTPSNGHLERGLPQQKVSEDPRGWLSWRPLNHKHKDAYVPHGPMPSGSLRQLR